MTIFIDICSDLCAKTYAFASQFHYLSLTKNLMDFGGHNELKLKFNKRKVTKCEEFETNLE